jgi:penicillin-binding protein 2
VLVLLFAALSARLLWFQVIRAGTYRRLSEENRARMLTIKAPRGTIRDRHGWPLAQDAVKSVLVAADTSVAYNLSPLAHSPMVAEPAAGGVVASDLGPEEVAVFEESGHLFTGLRRVGVLARHYPRGSAFSHVVGYVGEVSAHDLEADPRFRQGDLTGRSGIEKSYQSALRGTDGWEYVEVDARGTVVGPLLGKEPVLPVWGKDVTLSLDADLQELAFNLLSEQGKGAVVALAPGSGEVLALVSSPAFEPNLFSKAMSPSVWRRVHEDPGHPLLNRAIQSTYPPGSVFKLAVAAAALDAGVVRRGQTFRPCTGALRHGRRVFRCWKEEGHGALDVVGAIVQSCDVYFYQVGLELGLDRMSSYALSSGFGREMGLDVGPEMPGLIPTRDWYDAKLGPRGWTTGVLLNLSIGQGEILTTPLQIACYMAALATGGQAPTPRLIKSIGDEPVPQPPPSEIPTTPATIRLLQQAAVGVVQDLHGTARASMVPGLPIAGKTGTAQNPAGDDHSWFACYAPADDPQIAVAVIVENAGHGSTVAAPLACRLVCQHMDVLPPVSLMRVGSTDAESPEAARSDPPSAGRASGTPGGERYEPQVGGDAPPPAEPRDAEQAVAR